MKVYRPVSKVLTLIVCLVFISNTSEAQAPDDEVSYFDHLVEINAQWIHHSDIAPEGVISFTSDQERIQLHLKLVCEYLLNETPVGLSDAQVLNRQNLVKELDLYADNGIFPTNKYHTVRQPYFVDGYNVHCAVGYLMHKSGADDLVADIRRDHNYDYIKDIKTEGVGEWAEKYGFTIDELKWIQPGYPPQTLVEPIGGGTNGEVRDLYSSNYTNKMYITGSFDTLDIMQCLNIGVYEDGQLSCVGAGIEGTIYDVYADNDEVIVFGELPSGGSIYPAAIWDGNTWNYLSIPGRLDAIGHAGISDVINNSLEIVISHTSIPGINELWRFDTTDGWVKYADVNGEIFDIDHTYEESAYVGFFDQVNVYENGLVSNTILTQNFILNERWSNNWYTANNFTQVPDSILTVEYIGGAAYFGGTSNTSSGNQICVTRYLNDYLQTVVSHSDMSYLYVAVTDLAYHNGADIYFSGNFIIVPVGIGTNGRHLAKFNALSGDVYPLAVLDGPSNAVEIYEGRLYMGGEFLHNGWGWSPVKRLGRLTEFSGIIDPTQEELSVYPNPFDNIITIDGVEDGTQYEIIDASGKQIKSGSISNQRIEDLDEVAKGTYFLKLQTNGTTSVTQIVK